MNDSLDLGKEGNICEFEYTYKCVNIADFSFRQIIVMSMMRMRQKQVRAADEEAKRKRRGERSLSLGRRT